jgi:CBS domain-containing protein
MTADVLAVGPDRSLAEAAKHMVENGVRALPVTNENGEVLGIITDRHVMDHFLPAIAALGEAVAGERGDVLLELEAATVRDVMRRTVMCLREEQTLDEVATLMINKDIERFMVAAEGKLSGFVTRGDILRQLLPPSGAKDETSRKKKQAKPRAPAAENLEIRWESEESDET